MSCKIVLLDVIIMWNSFDVEHDRSCDQSLISNVDGALWEKGHKHGNKAPGNKNLCGPRGAHDGSFFIV